MSERVVDLPVLSVALSDADPDRRARLAAALRCGGLSVVAEGHHAAGLGGSREEPWHAAVLGADSLGAAELASIARLRDAWPEPRLVAVAASLPNASARRAFDAGAHGVVLEQSVEEALAVTVRAAHAGQLCVPGCWKVQFATPLLSARQKQILAMVVLGFTNGKIAGTLGVAESTVKSHLSTAFGKLGVRSRAQATALILDPENGLGTGILTIAGQEEGQR